MQRVFLLQGRDQILHGVEHELKQGHIGQTAVVIVHQDRPGLGAYQIHHCRIRFKNQFRKQENFIRDFCFRKRDFVEYSGEVSFYLPLR